MKKAKRILPLVCAALTLLLLASCQKAQTEEDTGGKIVIRTFLSIEPEVVEQYESDHPGIEIEQLNYALYQNNKMKLQSMYASGTAPDLLSIVALTDLPSQVLRSFASDKFDEYIKSGKATYLKEDDLQAANNAMRFDGKTQGAGKLYGVMNEISPSQCFFARKSLFEEAGVALPDPEKPMTYEELGALVKKLGRIEGNTITRVGLTTEYRNLTNFFDIVSILFKSGLSPYDGDFQKANYSQSAVKKYVDWAMELSSKNEWVDSIQYYRLADAPYQAFQNGSVALFKGDYWYGKLLDDGTDDLVFLPSLAVEGQEKRSMAWTSAGAIIYRQSKHPYETFEFMDYYFGGPPAVEKTKEGYSIPILRSYVQYMPERTPLMKQSKPVALKEAESMTVFPDINPYLMPSGELREFDTYLSPLMTTGGDVGEALRKIDGRIDVLIEAGVEVVGDLK